MRKYFSDDFDAFLRPMFNTFFENYNQDENGNTVLELEVPGFNEKNLSVEISNGILTIQGKTATKSIYKQYTLGQIEDVKANVQDGILSLTFLEPSKQVKKIALNQMEQKAIN